MQRVSECELVVFYGAAARLRRAAALCSGGGQPAGLAAAQNISPIDTGARSGLSSPSVGVTTFRPNIWKTFSLACGGAAVARNVVNRFLSNPCARYLIFTSSMVRAIAGSGPGAGGKRTPSCLEITLPYSSFSSARLAMTK